MLEEIDFFGRKLSILFNWTARQKGIDVKIF